MAAAPGFQLCYISVSGSGGIAFFAPKPPEEMYAEDWSKYVPGDGAAEPRPPYVNDPIVHVGWWAPTLDTGWREGHEGHGGWNVVRINRREIAWLFTPTWVEGPTVQIFAGVSVAKFRRLIEMAGGQSAILK